MTDPARPEIKKTFCRICTAYCGLLVEVEGGRIRSVRGDADDPMSRGYTCIKGRQIEHQLQGPQRLRGSQKRVADGSFLGISSSTAIEEIGHTLKAIMDESGPRAIASYSGTAAYSNSGTLPLIRAFHRGIDSPSNYSTLTIDQPSKIMAVARMGVWAAGAHTFNSADVILTIGNNPIVSGLTLPGGPPGTNPVRSFEDAVAGGLKVICVDPRRSETARRSHLHLQIRPGQDSTLLAGMLRVILDEDRHDALFCRDHVEGLGALHDALSDFSLDHVAARTEVPAEQIVEAARLFAKGPRGSASSGTGPDMGPHPSLTEHLISTLNAICGRYNREGEPIPNPGVTAAPMPRPAQAIAPELLPPGLKFGDGPRSRFRGLTQMFEEMPTTTLADEILVPGEGQIRALICVGGNPALAVPDSGHMVEALESLDLLVCIDLAMTKTALLSDYVLAAKQSIEREDLTEFMDMFYEVPYAHYSPAVVEPDFDVIDDWAPFVQWADRLGGKIQLPGGAVPLDRPLSKFDLLQLVLPQTRVPLTKIRDHDGGKIYTEVQAVAAPAIPGLEARLRLTPDGIIEELRALRAEDFMEQRNGRRTHLLIARRLKMVHNSVGHDFPLSQRETMTNPAYMNPSDLEMLGLEDGDLIEIESDRDSIEGVVMGSAELKPGVISMAHCWGSPRSEQDVRKEGANTSRLASTDHDYDALTGMARMSAIPVSVRPLPLRSS